VTAWRQASEDEAAAWVAGYKLPDSIVDVMEAGDGLLIMDAPRTLTIYRERYTVEDDGHGGSEAVETWREEDRHELTGTRAARTGDFHESPAREAVGILRREYVAWQADGGDWFGHDEPSCVDYATGEYERVAAHLAGFTATEERAVIRMMDWLDARQAERTAEYLSRSWTCPQA
jgi:hypothetical protein